MGGTQNTHEPKPEETVTEGVISGAESIPAVAFTDSLTEQHIQDRDALCAMFERVGTKLKTATTYQEVDVALQDEGYSEKTGESLLATMSLLHFQQHESELAAEWAAQQSGEQPAVEQPAE